MEPRERIRRFYETGRISSAEFNRLQIQLDNLEYAKRLFITAKITSEEFERRKKDIDERLQFVGEIVEAAVEEEVARKEYEKAEERPYDIDTLPGPYLKRVFVGGSYKHEMSTLREIANYLNQRGYTPIIAVDFKRPKGMTIHDFDLMLLHVCHTGLYELSHPAGQYNEVEAAFSYRVRSYGVCKSAWKGASALESRKRISTMVRDLFGDKGIHYYANSEELRRIIGRLFP